MEMSDMDRRNFNQDFEDLTAEELITLYHMLFEEKKKRYPNNKLDSKSNCMIK